MNKCFIVIKIDTIHDLIINIISVKTSKQSAFAESQALKKLNEKNFCFLRCNRKIYRIITMNTKRNLFITLFLGAIMLCAFGISQILASNNNDKTFIVRNNDTRDYKYEHYCDFIYEVNPDYYLDVLVETDEFQNYLEEHGEWWTN